MKNLHIWNVCGPNISKKIKDAIIESINNPPKTTNQMFEEIYDSIQVEKKKKIYNPLLMFI